MINIGSLNTKLISAVLIAGICFMFILYVWQIAAMASGRASYNSYLSKLQELVLRQNVLVINFSKADSLNKFQQRAYDAALEKVTTVSYIKIFDGIVARSYGQGAP